MEELDLAALSLLPDFVKRKILGSVLSGTPQPASTLLPHDAGAAAAAEDQQEGAHTAVAATDDIAYRELRLPVLTAGACIVDGVLCHAEAHDVAAAIRGWLQARGRRPGMGSAGSGGMWADEQHRGDITSWVTLEELAGAGQHLLAAVLRLIMSIKGQLAEQGYDVAGRCSVQLACYPGRGARYVRHTDASAAIRDRTVTALLYVNTDWDCQADGGQLVLYNASHACLSSSDQAAPGGSCAGNGAGAAGHGAAGAGHLAGEPALLVSPLAGRLLVFDSRLGHEVLPAQRHRFSITCWFYAAKTEGDEVPAAAEAEAQGGAELLQDKRKLWTAAPQRHPSSTAALPAELPPAAATEPSPAPAPAAHLQAPGWCVSSCGTHAPRIFVSIVAFRDDECQWTLRDLFLKAALPQRLFVGMVWQVDPQADAAIARMAGGSRTAAFQEQVRELRCHYRTASGPCAARSLAQQLWAGEEYVLQIDAHMRFVQDWDLICLEQLQLAKQAAGSSRVVLSTYPLGYSGAGAAAAVPDDPPATLLCAKAFDGSGLLRIQSRVLRDPPGGPVPSLFWAAGFSFAPASWLLEVPYCPHLPHLFIGEEVFMLARMWTRGWDVWAPSRAVLFHQWERGARSNSFQACVQVDAQARGKSQARVLQLLQHHGSCPDGLSGVVAPLATLQHPWRPPCDADWEAGGIWGLGADRTLGGFEEHTGVQFAGGVISERALFGGQEPDAFAD